MTDKIEAPLYAVSRHRLATDGEGVTTLVCFQGCPLSCAYCINERSRLPNPDARVVTPEELLAEVKVDDLYFLATGGGIMFGGGEPLLRADFIEAFAKIRPAGWKLHLESSLWVPRENLTRVLPYIDSYLIDCKDMHKAIYRAYTGQSGALMRENLAYLLGAVDPEKVTVRLPLIPGYNDDTSRDESERLLRAMGAVKFDRFPYKIPKGKQALQ